MNLVSNRILTDDVHRLAEFYERILGATARWATPVFAVIPAGAGEIAVAGVATLAFGKTPGIAEPGTNRSVFIEFLVDDVDAEYARLRDGIVAEFVLEPTTMPWGNRSLLFRDPDGNLINLFRRPSAGER
jgi:predicted enzyme related to lactoylglutathione lyase